MTDYSTVTEISVFNVDF